MLVSISVYKQNFRLGEHFIRKTKFLDTVILPEILRTNLIQSGTKTLEK